MQSPGAQSRHAAQGGFTLVELLVVMVLLSLVMLATGAALRTASQTEERVDARLQRMDDLRIVSSFLRSVLGRVSAEKTTLPVAAGASPYFFAGSAATVSWVGVMPARYGAAGRHHFRLQLLDSHQLVLSYVPWTNAANFPDWHSASTGSVVLLSDVRGMALKYQDATDEPPAWAPEWAEPTRLPDRISISINSGAGDWPDLVIPLRVLPASDPRSSGPSFGGGGR
ncbi:prepilin-type N-terminal cleavage/methylation domain-containing protein [Pulveribacter suum]|uniref:General secretion pathway protein GspJ n=1 Tax=Pulveribacter suum TaxID=2116657 RepID=A0A2P1NPC5_9BURK|nr:prepilin-type N-terminal cleavage/methylation domain-containing protein [Pulveribacter suum]AVP58857.1 general secretion pathway protein GspJ [Pulveribacter suum]